MILKRISNFINSIVSKAEAAPADAASHNQTENHSQSFQSAQMPARQHTLSQHVQYEEPQHLPEVVSLAKYIDDPPEQPPELIHNVLRISHKMILTGPSKAGKSLCLGQLAIAIASGGTWLGLQCTKGKVLYVNLEIDGPSCIIRFIEQVRELGLSHDFSANLDIWNLRGHSVSLDDLCSAIISRVTGKGYIAIILDPFYKIAQCGDENSASEIGKVCIAFDKICTATKCSLIYCHHHSKGANGATKAMNRSSGSGVFARDSDAILDMIDLNTNQLDVNDFDPGLSAWRIESTLREFPSLPPINIWLQYPIHIVDEDGILSDLHAYGSSGDNLSKSSKYVTAEQRHNAVDAAYNQCLVSEKKPTVKQMAEYMNITERCARDRIKDMRKKYQIDHGDVKKLTM